MKEVFGVKKRFCQKEFQKEVLSKRGFWCKRAFVKEVFGVKRGEEDMNPLNARVIVLI